MERIGSYAVVRKLGEGGMGVVYLARSRGGRHVAVKVARPELASDPSFRDRFRAEVAAARLVGGFHTAPVVDADPDAESPWLATAYVEGPTLSRLLATEGPMDEKRLRALGAALAEALEAVHRCGLVHRDLKPGNIIMAADGPRVLDFGISRAVENTRITTTGTAFGTPGFLAPEQAEGRDVTGAADVFALGAVLVAAAGGSAFGGGTPVALMYRSVHHDADVSAVPEAIRPMVAACLAKEAERRPSTDQLLDWFGDAGEEEAEAAPAEEEAPAVPPPPSYAPAVPWPVVPPSPALASAYPAYPAYPNAQGPAVPAPPDEEQDFLAMDRKNAVLADDYGISLGLNGRTTEFPWPLVDIAECDVAPGESVFRVAVVLTDGTVHTGRVSSRNPAELTWWAHTFNAIVRRHLVT
ncbi:Serine/threonine protein kinase [Actinacidiphila alni]|uniref:Serine/threonine protein kinase n=1 Tax=Actinacidiphila alni TaxID=380248 RepID=A0A1I2JEB7_9ACTN|nr:serine/threonine-protein kinase [Actinacidiphila alni]SFF52904.1 Serine/threonine protein kinase [Actinacidiphila alni]